MEGDGEDVLGGAPPGMQPVVVPGAGQMAAGWILRVFGALVFAPGACYAVGGTVALGAMLFEAEGGGRPDLVFVSLPVAGGVVVMALGSCMACFGAMLTGLRTRIEGSSFIRWAVLNTSRNIAFAFGVLLPVVVLGLVIFDEEGALVGFLLLVSLVAWAVGLVSHRSMKRLEKRQGPTSGRSGG